MALRVFDINQGWMFQRVNGHTLATLDMRTGIVRFLNSGWMWELFVKKILHNIKCLRGAVIDAGSRSVPQSGVDKIEKLIPVITVIEPPDDAPMPRVRPICRVDWCGDEAVCWGTAGLATRMAVTPMCDAHRTQFVHEMLGMFEERALTAP